MTNHATTLSIVRSVSAYRGGGRSSKHLAFKVMLISAIAALAVTAWVVLPRG